MKLKLKKEVVEVLNPSGMNHYMGGSGHVLCLTDTDVDCFSRWHTCNTVEDCGVNPTQQSIVCTTDTTAPEPEPTTLKCTYTIDSEDTGPVICHLTDGCTNEGTESTSGAAGYLSECGC